MSVTPSGQQPQRIQSNPPQQPVAGPSGPQGPSTETQIQQGAEAKARTGGQPADGYTTATKQPEQTTSGAVTIGKPKGSRRRGTLGQQAQIAGSQGKAAAGQGQTAKAASNEPAGRLGMSMEVVTSDPDPVGRFKTVNGGYPTKPEDIRTKFDALRNVKPELTAYYQMQTMLSEVAKLPAGDPECARIKADYLDEAAKYCTERREYWRDSSYPQKDAIQKDLMNVTSTMGKILQSDGRGITDELRKKDHDTGQSMAGVMRALLDPPNQSTRESVEKTVTGLMKDLADIRRGKADPDLTEDQISHAANNAGYALASIGEGMKDATMSANDRIDLTTGLISGLSKAVPGAGDYLAEAVQTVGDWAKKGNEFKNDDIMRSFLAVAEKVDVGESRFSDMRDAFNAVSSTKMSDYWKGTEPGSLGQAMTDLVRGWGINYFKDQATEQVPGILNATMRH